MAKHRGEILRKRIEESDLSINKVAQRSGVARATLYKLFEEPMASLDVILEVGKIIKYDFSKDVPELASFRSVSTEEENLNYRIKYFDLLEKYTAVLEEQSDYKKKRRRDENAA